MLLVQVEALRQQQAQLVAQRDRELAAMEAGLAHNAALIEERDQGIREISRQIGEVNEMFQDLAVLINDQGVQVRLWWVASPGSEAMPGVKQAYNAGLAADVSMFCCLCGTSCGHS